MVSKSFIMLTFTCLAAALCGCDDYHCLTKLEPQYVERLQVGQTTTTQAVETFGEPNADEHLKDGTRVLTYCDTVIASQSLTILPALLFYHHTDAEGRSLYLQLNFDRNGVLAEYVYCRTPPDDRQEYRRLYVEHQAVGKRIEGSPPVFWDWGAKGRVPAPAREK